MPKYRVSGSYGYVGTDWTEVVEADNLDEAEEIAKDIAYERVEFWAEEIESDAGEEE